MQNQSLLKQHCSLRLKVLVSMLFGNYQVVYWHQLRAHAKYMYNCTPIVILEKSHLTVKKKEKKHF